MDASNSSNQALVAETSQGKPKQKAKPKKDTPKTDAKHLANPSKGKFALKSTSKTKKKSTKT